MGMTLEACQPQKTSVPIHSSNVLYIIGDSQSRRRSNTRGLQTSSERFKHVKPWTII